MFDLVPEGFGKCIQHCYNDLGRPVITRQSVWDTYRLLLDALQLADKLPGEIQLLARIPMAPIIWVVWAEDLALVCRLQS